jgi:hypothetical protein
MDTLFKESVWSLARGDVFRNKFITRILTSLKILPVYRTSEGAENLSENYKTFENCIKLFRRSEVVMIFSEGKSINEWHLRPLKKGTARLAIKAWSENVPLSIIPVGINYSSFRRFGKNVFINFGSPIDRSQIPYHSPDGIQFQAFNYALQKQLEELVFEIPKENTLEQEVVLRQKPSFLRRLLLAIPAFPGFLFHAPLYLPIRSFAKRKLDDTDHYDSVVVALLFFCYPLYIILLTLGIFFWTGNALSFLLIIIFPFTAWAYVQLKGQLDK